MNNISISPTSCGGLLRALSSVMLLLVTPRERACADVQQVANFKQTVRSLQLPTAAVAHLPKLLPWKTNPLDNPPNSTSKILRNPAFSMGFLRKVLATAIETPSSSIRPGRGH